MSKQNSQQQQNLPKTPTQVKRLELESLSDSELNERYLNVFQTEGPEMEREQVIDAIMANSPNPGAAGLPPEEVKADGKTFTSKESGKKYIVGSEVGKGQIVVRQVNIDMMNGGMVEVPNTEAIQIYYKADFEKLSEDKPGKPSFFNESKIKVEVLSA